ncbi:MAG: hypothetical protein K2J68_05375 [Treponemataceae bacterium]|nr:hypothetical protein [Treponemataceae bacterium]
MKKISVVLLALITIVFLSGCISNVTLSDMKMKSNASSEILNLKLIGGEEANPNYYSHNYKKLSAGSISLLPMETKLIDGYLDESKPQYGYAVLEYTSDMEQGAMMFWGCAVVTAPLYLVGFPTDSATFKLTAKFSIYDSYGNLVQTFSKTDSFYHVAGIYYGKNPTKKAAKRFSALFTELFETAAKQGKMINQALLSSGPITQQKDSGAVAKILEVTTKIQSEEEAKYYSSNSSSNSNTSESINDILKSIQQGTKEVEDSVMNSLKNQKCGSCRGNGNCPSCGGTGKRSGNDCFSCHGSGVCTKCNGTGKAYAM